VGGSGRGGDENRRGHVWRVRDERRLSMTPSLIAQLPGVRAAPRGTDPGGSWRHAPNDPLQLTHGEVHVWRVDLNRSVPALPALLATLAPHELAKGVRHRFERDRNRYVLAHGALRSIVARYVDASPRDLRFRYGLRGKPELASGALHFNMSSSHDLAVVAIGRPGPIGVDIERLRDGVDLEVIRCFAPRAGHVLRALPKTARHTAFFQAWARMEAYEKARGEGLEAGLEALERFLDQYDVLQSPHRATGAERGWWFHDFSPRKGYVGALAVARAECAIRYWQWRAEDVGSAKHRGSNSVECGSGIQM